MKKSILLSLLLLLSGCNVNSSSNNDNSSSVNNSITSSLSSESSLVSEVSSSSLSNSSEEKETFYLMISLPQDQLHYQVNDKLNLEGIEIYLVSITSYTQRELTLNDVEVEDVDMSQAGEKKVNIKYQSYTGYFIIYVGTKLESPSNIVIDSLNNKVSWSNVENSAKYQVKISDSSKEYGIYEVETTMFYYDQYELLAGDYRFEVKSLSNDINYYDSDYSTFIKIHVKAEGELEALPAPTGLSDNVLSFSWNGNSLVSKWVINISKDDYSDEFEVSGSVTSITYKSNEHFKNLESGTYIIKIKAKPKDTKTFSDSSWSSSSFKVLEAGEKVKLGTPFGFVDAKTYAMFGYLANAKTFGVQIYTEENVFIKEVETTGFGFDYKNDLKVEEGIYVLYVYAKGYDVFMDSDLAGPWKINYMEG